MVGLRTAIVAGFATTALLFAPALAQAAEGIVVETTTLFAGPDSQFPPVDQVAAGTDVQVNGCLAGYAWCDVSFQNDRGWISGQALEILYQSRRVRIVEVTPDVVPFVVFEFNSYWDEHYRDRPFYGERDRYASININVNVTGGKGGPAGSGKETGKVSGVGAVGGQATGGAGKSKIVTNKMVTKGNKGAVAGTPSAGAVAGAKKGVTPPVVKKGCKPGEKGCPKVQGNGNGN
jgi:uncharacterized protein YraI